MENVGVWNSDILVMMVFAFFSPIMLAAIMKSLVYAFVLVKRPKFDMDIKYSEPDNSLDSYFIVHESELADNSVSSGLTMEDQWNAIIGSAMTKAMEGDKGARDWVTKHVFSEAKPQQSDIFTTSREIIREAHEALKSLGYKPAELKDKIKDLCKDKIYTSADDLIQDIIRGA